MSEGIDLTKKVRPLNNELNNESIRTKPTIHIDRIDETDQELSKRLLLFILKRMYLEESGAEWGIEDFMQDLDADLSPKYTVKKVEFVENIVKIEVGQTEVYINFVEQDIREIAELACRLVAKKCVIHPGVKGKITYRNNQLLTYDKAVQSLDEAFRQHGYTIDFSSEDFVHIFPSSTSNVPEDSSPEVTSTKPTPLPVQNKPKKIISRVVDASLYKSDLDVLWQEIRIVPNFRNGMELGVKILSVKAGSRFAKMGLRRGDVLLSVNDQEITVRGGTFDLFSQAIKNGNKFRLLILRAGEIIGLDVSVKE